MKPKFNLPGTKRLKLQCDILLSSSAFKFNLRRYTTADADASAALAEEATTNKWAQKLAALQQPDKDD